MIAYDLLMLGIVVGYAAFGAYKGMAWQIATLSSLVVSYFTALKFSDSLAPLLSQQAPWNRFLAMLVIFLGTSLAIWILFRYVSRFIEQVKLKDFDRQVGALFGLFKGVLACVAVTFFVVTLSETARATVLKSKSGHYIALLLAKADPIMPEQLQEVLGPYVDELQDKLKNGGRDAGHTAHDERTEDEAPPLGDLSQEDWLSLKRLVRNAETGNLDDEDLVWLKENMGRVEQFLRSPSAGPIGPTDGEPSLWEKARTLIEDSQRFQELLNELKFGADETATRGGKDRGGKDRFRE